mgnify:CR=1 FL=1
MAAFVIKATVKPVEIQSLWSMHFSQPGRMLNAKTAHYLQSNSMLSPMTINLSAHQSRAEAERMRREASGRAFELDSSSGLCQTEVVSLKCLQVRADEADQQGFCSRRSF